MVLLRIHSCIDESTHFNGRTNFRRHKNGSLRNFVNEWKLFPWFHAILVFEKKLMINEFKMR